MRRVPLALIFTSTLSLLTPAALSQSRPRACQEPPPLLPETNSDAVVIYRERPFDHAQVQHRLKTFSEHASSGQTRAEECFRYEVENAGMNEVRKLRWELADIAVDPLQPGPAWRRSKVRLRQIVDNPLDVDSRIDTFENTSVVTRAWDRRNTQAAARAQPARGLAVLQPNDVVPELSQWLQRSSLPNIPIVGFALRDADIGTPLPLIDRYSGAGIQLSTTSSVQRVGQEVRLQTIVTTTGSAARDVKYAMPALRALAPLKEPAKGLAEYVGFLSRFRALSNRVDDAPQESWTFSLQIPIAMLNDTFVYRMRHPIMLRFPSGGSDCVMVESYAPLALNFALRDCPGGP